MTLTGTEILTPPAANNDRLEKFLTNTEDQIKEGKVYLAIGIDTDFVKKVRKAIENPQETIDSITEALGKAFVLLFWEKIRTDSLTELISNVGVYVAGSKVRIWIYLKPESYTFENRSKFYELRADIANLSAFGKIEVDIMMLEEGEAELPETYKDITA